MAEPQSLEPLLRTLYASALTGDGLDAFIERVSADGTSAQAEGRHDPGRPGSRLLRQLRPHVRNAQAIQQRLHRLEHQVLALHQALDRFATGIALLDARGHCLWANRPIHALQAGNEGMQLSRERLRAVRTTDQLQLHMLIDAAVSGTCPWDARLLLHAPDGSPGLLLTISPLPVMHDEQTAETACAIAFVQPVVPHPFRAHATLKELFGFTDAEASLALALFESGDLALACRTLGKAMATGRAQLRMLMEKTGCHRQSGLFRALSAALMLPVTDTRRPHSPTPYE